MPIKIGPPTRIKKRGGIALKLWYRYWCGTIPLGWREGKPVRLSMLNINAIIYFKEHYHGRTPTGRRESLD